MLGMWPSETRVRHAKSASARVRPIWGIAVYLVYSTDMWKPYLKVIGNKASGAIHALDRFHIMTFPPRYWGGQNHSQVLSPRP